MPSFYTCMCMYQAPYPVLLILSFPTSSLPEAFFHRSDTYFGTWRRIAWNKPDSQKNRQFWEINSREWKRASLSKTESFIFTLKDDKFPLWTRSPFFQILIVLFIYESCFEACAEHEMIFSWPSGVTSPPDNFVDQLKHSQPSQGCNLSLA